MSRKACRIAAPVVLLAQPVRRAQWHVAVLAHSADTVAGLTSMPPCASDALEPWWCAVRKRRRGSPAAGLANGGSRQLTLIYYGNMFGSGA